jgi:hypothetical protein
MSMTLFGLHTLTELQSLLPDVPRAANLFESNVTEGILQSLTKPQILFPAIPAVAESYNLDITVGLLLSLNPLFSSLPAAAAAAAAAACVRADSSDLYVTGAAERERARPG